MGRGLGYGPRAGVAGHEPLSTSPVTPQEQAAARRRVAYSRQYRQRCPALAGALVAFRERLNRALARNQEWNFYQARGEIESAQLQLLDLEHSLVALDPAFLVPGILDPLNQAHAALGTWWEEEARRHIETAQALLDDLERSLAQRSEDPTSG